MTEDQSFTRVGCSDKSALSRAASLCPRHDLGYIYTRDVWPDMLLYKAAAWSDVRAGSLHSAVVGGDFSASQLVPGSELSGGLSL